MSRLVLLQRHAHTVTLATGVAAFLADHPLSPSSQRVYTGALRSLLTGLGADTPLAALDKPGAAEQLVAWFRGRYAATAPATRVRQLAILRSAGAFWRRRAWMTSDPTAALERPSVPLDRTRALTRNQIAALWRRNDVALRERAFWRLLYESAARANEILSLDMEDLDLPNKRARVRSKGGASSGCSGRPGRRCCCRGSWLAAPPAQSSWPIANRHGQYRASACVRSQAVPGCRTAAPPSSSIRRPTGGHFTSFGTLR